jgi:hypothetical protein
MTMDYETKLKHMTPDALRNMDEQADRLIAEITSLRAERAALNAAACNVIDSFYRIGDSADMDFVTALNELEDASADDGRIPRAQRRYNPTATPPPAPAAPVEDVRQRAITDTLKHAGRCLEDSEGSLRNDYKHDAIENMGLSIRHILTVLHDITKGETQS